MDTKLQVVATRCNDRESILEIVSEGFSCIEVDLMKTSDNKLVVGHPKRFQARNYTERQVCISEGAMSFDQLARIISDEKLFVFLDLKYEDMGALAAREVLRLGLQDRTVLLSWGQQNLVNVLDISLDIKTGWIFNGALAGPKGDFDRLRCFYFVTCHYYLTETFLRKLRVLGPYAKLCIREAIHKSELEGVVDVGADYFFVQKDSWHLVGLRKTLEGILR